jgi:hypothetical protein
MFIVQRVMLVVGGSCLSGAFVDREPKAKLYVMCSESTSYFLSLMFFTSTEHMYKSRILTRKENE